MNFKQIFDGSEIGLSIEEDLIKFRLDAIPCVVENYASFFKEWNGKEIDGYWTFNKTNKDAIAGVSELVDNDISKLFTKTIKPVVKVFPSKSQQQSPPTSDNLSMATASNISMIPNTMINQTKPNMRSDDIDFLSQPIRSENSMLSSINKIGNNDIDTSVPQGTYPREIFRDRSRDIIVSDYTEKSVTLFCDWKLIDDFCQKMYQTSAKNVIDGLCKQGNFKIDHRNDMIKKKGFCFSKASPKPREFLKNLCGIDVVTLATATTTDYASFSKDKKSYNNKYNENKMTDKEMAENMGKISMGTSSNLFQFPTEIESNNLLGNTFIKQNTPGDLFNDLIISLAFQYTDVQEKTFIDPAGHKRICIYGPIEMVDNKFKSDEAEAEATEFTILIDGSLIIDSIKIMSYIKIRL